MRNIKDKRLHLFCILNAIDYRNLNREQKKDIKNTLGFQIFNMSMELKEIFETINMEIDKLRYEIKRFFKG